MSKNILTVVGITILFLGIVVTPMTLGYDVETTGEQPDIERYLYPEYYDCYSVDEIDGYVEYQDTDVSIDYEPVESSEPLDGPPMDSPWPMYCHDVRHTGRSPYTTFDTYETIWRYHTLGSTSSPVIDDDGVLYVGSQDFEALYPNGTLKWSFTLTGWTESCPAINENGTIYTGTIYGSPCALYAFNPDGTLEWKYPVEDEIFSSPAIGNDGTIYFGSQIGYPLGGYINALYPNGTVKWRYKTNHLVFSSPAIGEDGTIYCGCHDNYLYALYPNNGTLKWKFKTENWIRVSPCIADDGTIYVVSLDDYLYALYPNGTLKWKTDVGAGTSPTIGQDGTIYAGYTKLHAINPANGSVKWKFNVGGTMRGGTPCNSIDGTIIVGTSDGGQIIAINPNGTEKWRKSIGECESAPAIGEDGTIYIGSNNDYLYAFGWYELEADANGPYYGQINESIQFQGSAKGGYKPYSYYWDFGDGNNSEGEDPTHIYSEPGNYTVVFTVTDNTSNTSSDTSWALIQEINYPPKKPIITGPKEGVPNVKYNFTFLSFDPEGSNITYYVIWWETWIDGPDERVYGPYPSGTNITVKYTYETYFSGDILAKAEDESGQSSDWAYWGIVIPRNRATTYLWYQWFLDRHPMLERLLSLVRVI